MAHNMCPGLDWVPAIVVERLRLLTYLVKTTDHLLWKGRVDFLLELKVNSLAETSQDTESDPLDIDIPLGDTPSMDTPPKELTIPPEPLWSEQEPEYCP